MSERHCSVMDSKKANEPTHDARGHKEKIHVLPKGASIQSIVYRLCIILGLDLNGVKGER